MKSGSEALRDANDAITTLSQRKEVGKAVKQELAELAVTVEEIRARVAEIEDLYAIDFGSDIDERIKEATRLWNEAPDGRIIGPELLPLRRSSPVLSTLFLKGIDIQSAFKFSGEQRRLSREIGTDFDRTSDVLRALRKERRSEKDPEEWSALVPMRKSLRETLDKLVRLKLIEGRRLLARNKAGKWAPLELKWLRDEPETDVIIVYEKKDNVALQFLRGEWLNCYVADIIRDQLERHEIPFELYTDISYSAPADLIRASSEFDVIGRFRDSIICVECKSGRLDAERGAFKDIVQRTEALRKVLSSVGGGETSFMFFVVYDPATNAEEEMKQQLLPRSITPLKPTEVRSVMAQVLERAAA